VTIQKMVRQFTPRVVVIDPISNFAVLGNDAQVRSMLTRLIDYFKTRQITALFTSLTAAGASVESTEVGVSSLMDSWLLLRDVEVGAERNRVLNLLKSRGMAHSNQVREFLLTAHGLTLKAVYAGPSGVLLTGSARVALESRETAQALVREQETEGAKRALERKRLAIAAQIAVLRAEFASAQTEATKTIGQDHTRAGVIAGDRVEMTRRRQSKAGAERQVHKDSRNSRAIVPSPGRSP
jgi:circadian clock protein KaiC